MSRIRSTTADGSCSPASFSLSWPGASMAAARRCRSGALGKLNRNASGAVSETDIPCGTIGFLLRVAGGRKSLTMPAIG